MSAPGPGPESDVAELVEQLGHCVCAEAFSRGLNPAQWSALRYFRRANRFSRTVTAFARYHGTTRGTASQTVRSLVDKGYLERRRSKRDQRSFRLDLTGTALRLLEADPFDAFVCAARALPHDQCSAVARGLRSMLQQVLESRAQRPFGVCTSCRNLRRDGPGAEGDCEYRCVIKDESLGEADLAALCIDFEPLPAGKPGAPTANSAGTRVSLTS